MIHSIKRVGLLASALLFFLIAIKLHTVTASIYSQAVTDDDRYYLPPAKWLRAFSFGYNEAAADAVWIKTLIYFGDRFSLDPEKCQDSNTSNYLLTAADLDPKFARLYYAGSSLTLFQCSRVSKESVDMSIGILERGMKEFPNNGKIAFDLGFMHYYEMEPFLPRDKNDPKRRFHKEEGTSLMRKSTLMEGAPPYATMLATTLMSREGFDELVVEHLKAMLLKETDKKIRQSLIYKLRKEVGKTAERDIRASERIQARWRRELPFVPYDFFLVLQPQISVDETLDPLSLAIQFLEPEDDGTSPSEEGDGL